MIINKICSRCFMAKPPEDFQKRLASKDGLTAACKKCLSEYDKTRANLPHRVKARKEYAKTDEGKKAAKKSQKKWLENNTIKRAAHIITGNRIRDGKLIKEPCEKCGTIENICAHHDDYAKPLEVRWLCAKHHYEWHKENGEGLNGE